MILNQDKRVQDITTAIMFATNAQSRTTVTGIWVRNAIQLPSDAPDWSSEELIMGKALQVSYIQRFKLGVGVERQGSNTNQNPTKKKNKTTTTSSRRLQPRHDRRRGFVVGTAEFGTRLNCGSHRGPTLLLDDSQAMIGEGRGFVGAVRGTEIVVADVQQCCLTVL